MHEMPIINLKRGKTTINNKLGNEIEIGPVTTTMAINATKGTTDRTATGVIIIIITVGCAPRIISTRGMQPDVMINKRVEWPTS